MKTCDFLVIGSGIAGLIYALDVAKTGKVTVLSKGNPTEGSTRYAQGGIASVMSPLDSFEAHIHDTLKAGAGLCDEEIVNLVVTEGPKEISHLVDLGTNFDTLVDSFSLAQEGGHSQRRILHSGDRTGAEIQRAIYEQALNNPNIEILSEHLAIDLITSQTPQGECVVEGAYVLDRAANQISPIAARVTMIASGGVGKVYLYTTNPDIATGDGIAMAYRAGAKIHNMEFIQFHPTCLYHREAKNFLLTEALRGEGAILTRRDGARFMDSYDSRGELASRDIVARAIDDQMKQTGDDFVLLDISHQDPEFVRTRFPTIYEKLLSLGMDITKEPIPVVPAAHYCCGGIKTDSWGKTNLHRLYAAGEAACTGLHGANRLASNSLLEAMVFSGRAAKDCARRFSLFPKPRVLPAWDSLGTRRSKEEVVISHTWDEVRRVMWNLVGIVRSSSRLELAKRRLDATRREIRAYYWNNAVTSDLLELRNIIDVAELIVRSAMLRKESRGLHYNVDYPQLDDENWKKDTVL